MTTRKATVIRPHTNPYTLPDAPIPVTDTQIQQMHNLWQLMALEHQYTLFIERREHVLALLDILEDIIDTRNLIIMRINQLLRHKSIVIFPNTFSDEYVMYKKPSSSRLVK